MVDIAEKKKEQEKEEVALDPQEAEETDTDVKREWTAFEAYINAKEAKMLAAWLKLNNIKIRRI